MTESQRRWRRRIAAHVALWSAGVCVIAWAFARAEFSLTALSHSGPGFADFFDRLKSPDWSVTGDVLAATVETLTTALAGTALAVGVSLPLGFLAASNVSPRWLSTAIKTVLGAIRSVPLIIVAVVFVAAVGLGPFPGMLAIAFHSTGMLGKFYAEEFETANQGIVDAIDGTGASRLQTLRYGLFSQSVPQVVAFTVYRFEMNFRDATVLGLVGAGGIGYYIRAYVGSFQYERVAVLLVVICLVVFVLDQITFQVRKLVQ